MSIKQFLKPTNFKLIIWIAIFIISVLELSIFSYGRGDIIFTWQDPILHSFHWLIQGTFSPIHIFGTWTYWYLLSCLIVWIYDKVKKK